MSYKVGVKTTSDAEWVFNALRFPTKQAAAAYGRDLANRWTSVKEWDIFASDDPVSDDLAPPRA